MIRGTRWRQLQEAALDQPNPTLRLKRVLAAITLEDLAVVRRMDGDAVKHPPAVKPRQPRVYKGKRLLDAMSQIDQASE